MSLARQRVEGDPRRESRTLVNPYDNIPGRIWTLIRDFDERVDLPFRGAEDGEPGYQWCHERGREIDATLDSRLTARDLLGERGLAAKMVSLVLEPGPHDHGATEPMCGSTPMMIL